MDLLTPKPLSIVIKRFIFLWLAITLCILPACTPDQQQVSASAETENQTQPVTSTTTSPTITTHQPTRSPSQTANPQNTSIWLDPILPDTFTDNLDLPKDWSQVEEDTKADFHITVGKNNLVSTWIFSVVAPFPTIADTITSAQLTDLWMGKSVKNSDFQNIFVSPNDREIISHILGEYSSKTVNVVSSNNIQEKSWNNPNSLAIIPFEELNPKWKVIQIDGTSPIHKDFASDNYLLSIPFSLVPNNSANQNETDILTQINAPLSNRDPEKMTSLVLTGVTALVRATAVMMERKGNTYPAQDIRDILIEADITHINNEVPFAKNCAEPFLQENNLVFCSQTDYIELLEDIGTDVIELSGDHFQDYGAEAMLYTIDLYKERGWKMYGGGINLNEGKKPLLIEHNGNKIALLGCNAKSIGYARASDTQPGAVHCDWEWLDTEIQRVKKDGYLPVVTFQHEELWSYDPSATLQNDFFSRAEAGAVIVSGSQAHQPQTMTFHSDAFIHYGLGNLFFDQYYEGLPTRQAFIDRHIFYDGKYISTELLTIMFVDLARSRPMTEQERTDLLETIFNASHW